VREFVELFEQGPDLAQARSHQFEHGFSVGFGQVLCQTGDLELRRATDAAAVQVDLATDDFHQAGFAGAIASDQTQALAFFDIQVDAIKQYLKAVTELSIFKTNQRHVATFTLGKGRGDRHDILSTRRWRGFKEAVMLFERIASYSQTRP